MANTKRTNLSFDDRRLEDIGRENISLLNRLASVATRKPVNKEPSVLKVESSAQRNRRKQAQEIERQNLMLLKKLQATKGTIPKSNSIPGPRGTAAMVNRPSTNNHNSSSSSSSSSTYRAEWVDVTSQTRQSNGFALNDNNSGSNQATRKQFKSGDVRDIALQACPDTHTLR